MLFCFARILRAVRSERGYSFSMVCAKLRISWSYLGSTEFRHLSFSVEPV